MESTNILQSIISFATVEIVLVVIVFKLILGNYKPPIQQSLQALICVAISVTLAMVIQPNVHSFMAGIISAGIGFYGGTYLNEIKGLKNDDADDEK